MATIAFDLHDDVAARRSDAEQIRGLYNQLMDGWNHGSAEAFAAPFVEDCEFIPFDGARFNARHELIAFHEELFKTHLKGTRLVGDVTDIRFLADDVAVMHATGGTIAKGKTAPSPERDSIQTLTAIRKDGVWRLVTFQNTRVRPIGRSVSGTLLWLISDRFWKWCLPKSVHARRR
jgi:uncharacterized protein (TIGR02246 family)